MQRYPELLAGLLLDNTHLPGVNVRTHHGKHVALALARVERVSGHPPQHGSRVLPKVLDAAHRPGGIALATLELRHVIARVISAPISRNAPREHRGESAQQIVRRGMSGLVIFDRFRRELTVRCASNRANRPLCPPKRTQVGKTARTERWPRLFCIRPSVAWCLSAFLPIRGGRLMDGSSNTTSGALFAKSSRHGTTSLSTNSRRHAAMIPQRRSSAPVSSEPATSPRRGLPAI